MDLFSPENIRRWAYTTELDEAFERFIDEDDSGDLFDYEMSGACSLETVLEFARDRNCLKRDYFLHELASRLCKLYEPLSWPSPFGSSHRRAILDKEEYLEGVKRMAEQRYELCQVLDSMLDSGDDLIEYIRNTLYLFPYQDAFDSIWFRDAKVETPSLYDACRKAYNEKCSNLHKALNRLIKEL